MSTDAGISTRRVRGGSLLSRFMLRGSVRQVRQVTRSMRAIRIGGPGLEGVTPLPGQQVRVLVGDPFTRRTYSVLSADPQAGEVELCVLDHEGDGPGARWARTVERGQEVALSRPEGNLLVRRDAPYHLFVGEETAMVPFVSMIGFLDGDGDGAEVHGVIELRGPEDRLPGIRKGAVEWIYRGEESAASSQRLVRAVAGLDLPSGPGVAYVAGEARTCQAVRGHLVRERGWPRRSVVVKPFWAPGKRGME